MSGSGCCHEEQRSQTTVAFPPAVSNLKSREYACPAPQLRSADDTVRCGSLWGGPSGTANRRIPPRNRLSGGGAVVGDGMAVGVTNGVAVGPGVGDGVGAGVGAGVDVGVAGMAVGSGSSSEH